MPADIFDSIAPAAEQGDIFDKITAPNAGLSPGSPAPKVDMQPTSVLAPVADAFKSIATSPAGRPSYLPPPVTAATPEEQMKQAGEAYWKLGPERVAQGAKELVKSGTLSNAQFSGLPPAAPPVPVDRPEAYKGVSDISSGIGVATLPLAGPALSTVGGALKLGAGLVAGTAASEGAGALTKKMGGSPEAQQAAKDAGFWFPALVGGVLGATAKPKVTTLEGPGGWAKGVEAFPKGKPVESAPISPERIAAARQQAHAMVDADVAAKRQASYSAIDSDPKLKDSPSAVADAKLQADAELAREADARHRGIINAPDPKSQSPQQEYRAGAAVAKTPDEYAATIKVGGKSATVRIPRKGGDIFDAVAPEKTPAIESPVTPRLQGKPPEAPASAKEVRAAAVEQQPTLVNNAEHIAAQVPGARVEDTGAKTTESIQRKLDQGREVTDGARARIVVPNDAAKQDAARKVAEQLPVAELSTIQAENLPIAQAKLPNGQELQIATEREAKTQADTHDLYAKQQEALAAGDKQKAGELQEQLDEKHADAAQPANADIFDHIQPADRGADRGTLKGRPVEVQTRTQNDWQTTRVRFDNGEERDIPNPQFKRQFRPATSQIPGVRNSEGQILTPTRDEHGNIAGYTAQPAPQPQPEPPTPLTPKAQPTQPATGVATQPSGTEVHSGVVTPESGAGDNSTQPESNTPAGATYYHGTNNAAAIRKHGFSVKGKGSPYLGDNFADGVYLSKSAADYEEGGQLQGVQDVLPINIADGLNIKQVDSYAGVRQLYKQYGIGELDPKGSSKITAALKKDGYDGLDIGHEIVVFDPKNVKLSNATPAPSNGAATQPASPTPLVQGITSGTPAQPTPSHGAIAVDLDNTLATYKEGNAARDPTAIGAPMKPEVDHVKQLLADGKEVWIFSARAKDPEAVTAIKAWTKDHIGQELPVTNVKHPEFASFIDDRAVQPGGDNAVPEQGATGVLQREPEKAGIAGSGRGRIQPGEQRQEAAGAGTVAERDGKGDAGTPSEKPEVEPKYKFGSTQANIHFDSEAAKAIESARGRISDSDLAGQGKDVGDGGNHVTVRYGIQGEDTAGIRDFLKQQQPFQAKLGKTEKFPPSEHSDGAAVIVAPIKAPELHRLNADLEKHGNFTEPSFKEYKPHATIAYVDPAKADRYVGMNVTEGKTFTVDSVAITDRDGKQEMVKLEGRAERPAGVLRAEQSSLRDDIAHADKTIARTFLPKETRETAAKLKAMAEARIAEIEKQITGKEVDSRAPQEHGGKNVEGNRIAEKFRTMADAMQPTIDDKFRSSTQNPTPKRNAQEASRRHDGRNLERAQKALRALADAHEAGTVPPILAKLRTKNELHDLVRKGLTGEGGYYARIEAKDYSDKSPAGVALQGMIDSSMSPDAIAKRDNADKLRNLEQGVSLSHIPGYFPTPKPVVETMLQRADIRPGMSVLEPSAGKGDIADAVKAAVPDTKIDTVEQNYNLSKILELKGHNVAGSDFMEHRGKYDRVVMNPPFEKGADMEHVQRAYSMLNPGGKMVSIMGPHFEFGSDRKSVAFREWLDSVNGEVEKLPESSFKQSGTGVASRMVTIAKPAASPEAAAPKSVDTSKQAVTLKKGAAIRGSDGKATVVKTPNGDIPAKYKVVEAGSLVTSHNADTFAKSPGYPEGVQERAYHSSKEAQNRVIQQAANYDPSYTVNTNPDAVNGPPIVTEDGIVLGGNSRAMSTRRMYSRGGGKFYRDAIKEQAATFGIDPAKVDDFQKPVLIRQIEKPKTADEARRIASDLNKSMTGALGVSEKAVSAGKSITIETLRTIAGMVDDMGGDASIRDVLRDKGRKILPMLEKDGLITARERPAFVDTSTGGLSEEGKTFVERALHGMVVDDPTLMDRVPKNVLNKLDGSLADIVGVAQRTDEYNVLPLLREALAEHADIAARSSDVDTHLAQAGMLGPERNPAVDAIIRKLAEKPKAVKAALRQYAQDAAFDKQGQGMLMVGEQPAAVKAFNDAFGANLTEDELQQSLIDAIAKSAQTTNGESDVSRTQEETGSAVGNLQQHPESTASSRNPGGTQETSVADDPATANILKRAEESPPFYLKSSRLIAAKMPNRASAVSVLSILKNNGVKEDELKWTGLDDYLKTKGFFTKQEVQDYLKANNISVQDVMLGRSAAETAGRAEREKLYSDTNRQWSELSSAVNRLPIGTVDTDLTGTLFNSIGKAQRIAGAESYPDIEGAIKQFPAELQPKAREFAESSLRLHDLDEQFPIKQEKPTKFASYVTPGGENYRELLLTLPPDHKGLSDINARLKQIAEKTTQMTVEQREADPSLDEEFYRLVKQRDAMREGATFKSGHFDEPNVLAHVRFNDRVDSEGKKVLFLEEVQSDWHQKGRKRGYQTPPPTPSDVELKFVHPSVEKSRNHPGYWESFDKRNGEMITRHPGMMSEPDAREEAVFFGKEKSRQGVPDAPFKSDWHELAMKRMLRYAAEHGYERISWTTGDMQNERYDLSKHISRIEYQTVHDDAGDFVGTYDFYARDHNGNKVVQKEEIPLSEIEELVGKEIAQKIEQDAGSRDDSENKSGYQDWRALSGLDLKVGGSGMKGFYDKMLPSFLNKYGKKWGAKVGETEIATSGKVAREAYAVSERDGWFVEAGGYRDGPYRTKQEVDAKVREVNQERQLQSVPSLDITPEMRKSVMEEGQPLFRPVPTTKEAIRGADQIKIVTHPASGRVPAWIEANQPAMDVLALAFNARFAGVTVHGPTVERLIQAIDGAASVAQEEKRFRAVTQLRDFGRQVKAVSQFNGAAGVPIATNAGGMRTDTVSEELFHSSVQFRSGEGQFKEGVPWRQLQDHPVIQKMLPGLEGEVGKTNKAAQVAEAIVDVWNGEYGKHGITNKEAAQLAYDYFSHVPTKALEDATALQQYLNSQFDRAVGGVYAPGQEALSRIRAARGLGGTSQQGLSTVPTSSAGDRGNSGVGSRLSQRELSGRQEGGTGRDTGEALARKDYDSVESRTPPEDSAGSLRASVFGLDIAAEYAAKFIAGVDRAYDRGIDAFLQKIHMGRAFPEVERADPQVARDLRELAAAPSYYRDKADKIVEKITNGMTREQEKGFVLMADETSRKWLQDNRLGEYQKYVTDDRIQQALKDYKPHEDELRDKQKALGGSTIEEDYLRRVYTEHVGGLGQKNAAGEAKPSANFNRVITPQMANQKGRIASAEYYYHHGLHEFGPSFATRYIATNLKVAEHRAAITFLTKATRVENKDGLPETIEYNGQTYFRPDMARLIRESANDSEEGKKIAADLGIDQLPKPSRVNEYSIYDPTPPDKSDYQAKKLAQQVQEMVQNASGTKLRPEDMDELIRLSAAISYSKHSLYLGPREIVEAFQAGARHVIPSWLRALGEILKPVSGMVRRQVIGLGAGVPHIKNILRRVVQTSPGAHLDPRSYARAARVLFSQELRKRGIKGVDDPAFDALLKHGAISSKGIESYRSYIQSNTDAGRMERAWNVIKAAGADWKSFEKQWLADIKAAHREGKVIGNAKAVTTAIAGAVETPIRPLMFLGHHAIFSAGGIDQRARLWLYDLIRSQEPGISDDEMAHRINDQLGRYNKASWTDFQKDVEPFTFFPGWDYSSVAWVLRHPLKTTVAAALLTLIANRVIHNYGKNAQKDSTDLSRVHYGKYSISDNIFRERLGAALVGSGMRFASSKLRGQRSEHALRDAVNGVSSDARAFTGMLNPLAATPLELALGKELATGHDIIPAGDRQKRGKPEKDLGMLGARKLFPAYSAIASPEAGQTPESFALRNLGVSVFKNMRKHHR